MSTVAVTGSVTGGVVSLGLSALGLRNRSTAGAVPFGWLMLAAAGWCFIEAAWLVTADPAVAETLFLLIRLSAAAMTGLWLVFALVYTGREAWITPARLAGLFLVTGGYALALLTAPLHGLVDPGISAQTVNGMTAFVADTGPAYTAQTAVSYGVIGVGYGLLSEFLLRSRNVYRKQTFFILLGGLLTGGAHAVFVLGATSHPGFNVAPLAFSLNGLLVGWALFRHDFLTVSPLAGDLLVEELPDPVLVLDDDDRLVDCNSAASGVIGGGPADAEDRTGERLTDIDPELLARIERGDVFSYGTTLTFYDPQASRITDQHGDERGRLVVLRDITGQQRRQDRLEALQAATQQFIEAERRPTVARLAVDFATEVLDQNAAGVFLLDEDGCLEPTAISDEVDEYVDDDLLYVDPEEMPEDNLWRTYESGERQIASLDQDRTGPLETALMLPLGDHGTMAIGSQGATYADEDEQYAHILAQTTQVALDQVERERELRQSRASVERRTEQVEFFNGVLRHSLRNAMLVVRGRADHLREHVSAQQRRHVDTITTWCGRLTDLSRTIRDINDTVTASEAERLESVDLSKTIRNAVAAVDTDGVDVDVDLDPELWVQANDLTEEVVISVLQNAIQHNDAPEPRVEIDVQRAGEWLQVRIADNGPGISDDLKSVMFERSITPNQTAGGFGLYFVSVMMDLYDGKVWFEDNDPRGTVAMLEFRQAGAASTDDETGDRAETPVTDEPSAETQGKSPGG